eukprot:scaffold73_cov252-Pinguiococcus_pyrenoidosus.AAC.11
MILTTKPPERYEQSELQKHASVGGGGSRDMKNNGMLLLQTLKRYRDGYAAPSDRRREFDAWKDFERSSRDDTPAWRNRYTTEFALSRAAVQERKLNLDLKAEVSQMRQENEKLRGALGTAEKGWKNAIALAQTLEQRVQRLNDDAAHVREHLDTDRAAMQRRVNAKDEEVNRLHEIISGLRQERDHLQDLLSSREHRESGLEEEMRMLETSRSTTDKQLNDLQAEVRALKEERDEKTGQVARLQALVEEQKARRQVRNRLQPWSSPHKETDPRAALVRMPSWRRLCTSPAFAGCKNPSGKRATAGTDRPAPTSKGLS